MNPLVEESLAFAVNGTLMRGLERNANLVEAGATFRARSVDGAVLPPVEHRRRASRDAPRHERRPLDRRRDLAGSHPPASRRSCSPSPTGSCVGRLTLDDGSEVLGVLAEPALVEAGREITEHGGWRAYVAAAPVGRDAA